MNTILTSWKTTLAGALVLLCGGTEYFQLLGPKYSNELHAICGLAIAFGLIAAKDGNVSNAPAPTQAAKVPSLLMVLFLSTFVLSACATTAPNPVAESLSAPIATGTQDVGQSLDLIANNPLLSAVNKDATDTLAWVNSPAGPTDPLAKLQASACPQAILAATASLQANVASLKTLLGNMSADATKNLSSPELLLALTKLRYAPAGAPGADPSAMIAQLKSSIFAQVTAVCDMCRSVFPAKQVAELVMAAGKIGGVAMTGGAAAPLLGLVP